MSLQRILDDLADNVRQRLEDGERTVEMNTDVLQALRVVNPGQAPQAPQAARATRPAPSAAAAPAPPPGETSRRTPAAAPPPPAGDAPYLRFGTTPELTHIADRIAVCTACNLCTTRSRTVPGQGNPHPEIVFIGEGPGAEEDRQGLTFIGPAGQLLTRLVVRMGFAREEVWIGNIVKCRPTVDLKLVRDRPPDPEEMAACMPYLLEQLAVLKPKVIVALGSVASKALLKTETGITQLRGTWGTFAGIDLMPTFHPSYLLRGGGDEKARYWDVWQDMSNVLRKLGRPVPTIKGQPGTT